MSQSYVTLAAPRRPIAGVHLHTAVSTWRVSVAAVLTWSDGTIESVPQNTPILPQTDTIDMTTDYWLVVWKQGSPTLPLAIKLKDFANLQALVGGTWGVSHWITDDVAIFQQA